MCEYYFCMLFPLEKSLKFSNELATIQDKYEISLYQYVKISKKYRHRSFLHTFKYSL